MLTGNKVFVANIKATIDSINQATRQLLLLHGTASRYKNKQLFSVLDSLVKLRVAFTQEVLLLTDNDKKRVIDLIATARGKELTDQIAAVSKKKNT